jgi:hypothetical protein
MNIYCALRQYVCVCIICAATRTFLMVPNDEWIILRSWVWSSTRCSIIVDGASWDPCSEEKIVSCAHSERVKVRSPQLILVSPCAALLWTHRLSNCLSLLWNISPAGGGGGEERHQSVAGSKPTDALTSVSSDRRLFPNPAQTEEIIQLRAKSPRMSHAKRNYWLQNLGGYMEQK